MSKISRIRDHPSENVFGVFNGDTFVQPLSNFTISFLCEVRAGSESGFLCDVILFNGVHQVSARICRFSYG